MPIFRSLPVSSGLFRCLTFVAFLLFGARASAAPSGLALYNSDSFAETLMQKSSFTPACNPPSQASVSQVSANSALLEWSGVNNAQFYFIYYRKTGTQRWAFRRVAGQNFELNGLSPCSEYEVQIRSGCAWGFPSREAKEIRFSTQGTAPELEIKAYRLSACEVGLKATLGFDSYHWSVAGADSNKVIVTRTGHYNVVAIDSNGCSVTAGKTVNLNISPFFCVTPEEEAALGRAIQNHKPQLIEDLKLCAKALAGVMDNEKVKRQVARLAADTQRVEGGTFFHVVRLEKLAQTCREEEGLNLFQLMAASLLRNGASQREILRLRQIINGYSIPGGSRAVFYPTIYFPYLDTSIRGAQTPWDGVSVDYVSVGSLFACEAEYPTYIKNLTTGRVVSGVVSSENLIYGKTWKVILEDNFLDKGLDLYRMVGRDCYCKCNKSCYVQIPDQTILHCGRWNPVTCSCPHNPTVCDCRPAWGEDTSE